MAKNYRKKQTQSQMQCFCCFVWISVDEFGDSPLLTKVKQQVSAWFNSQMQNSQRHWITSRSVCKTRRGSRQMESSDNPARNTRKWSVCMCYEEKNYCISTIKDVDYTSVNPRFGTLLEFWLGTGFASENTICIAVKFSSLASFGWISRCHFPKTSL